MAESGLFLAFFCYDETTTAKYSVQKGETLKKGKNAMKQLAKFIAVLLANLPEMTADVMQGWIENPGAVKRLLSGFAPPDRMDLTGNIKQWEDFYLKAFGRKLDLSGVKIPERTEEQKKDFTRLLIIAEGLTNNQVYDACAKHFPCSRYNEDLDKGVPKSERDPRNGAYAIWVRDTVEADEVHKNKSANMVKSEGLKTETLLERMLHELKYFLETEKHLDMSNWTLCSGSRRSDGDVPRADWSGDEFRVYWHCAGNRYDRLRSREAISCP